LGAGDGRLADFEADLALVGLAAAALAAVGAEAVGQHAQRLAGAAAQAARAEEGVAKAAPALEHPPHVLGGGGVGAQLVLQPPPLPGQVAAGAGRGDEAVQGFHGGRSGAPAGASPPFWHGAETGGKRKRPRYVLAALASTRRRAQSLSPAGS